MLSANLSVVELDIKINVSKKKPAPIKSDGCTFLTPIQSDRVCATFDLCQMPHIHQGCLLHNVTDVLTLESRKNQNISVYSLVDVNQMWLETVQRSDPAIHASKFPLHAYKLWEFMEIFKFNVIIQSIRLNSELNVVNSRALIENNAQKVVASIWIHCHVFPMQLEHTHSLRTPTQIAA